MPTRRGLTMIPVERAEPARVAATAQPDTVARPSASKAPHVMPTWARIILDGEFSSAGEVWRLAEVVYKDGIGLGLVGGEAPGDIVDGTGGIDRAGLTVSDFRDRYPPEKTEESLNGADKGITYYVYDPIALGFRTSETRFTWLRAQRRFYEDGFVNTARKQERPETGN